MRRFADRLRRRLSRDKAAGAEPCSRGLRASEAPNREGSPCGLPARGHLESRHVYSWAPTACWAWGQSDPELVPVPKIKARLADYEEEVGVREPRERKLWGEMGGGALKAPALWRSGWACWPHVVPPKRARGLCNQKGAVRSGAAGQSREPGARGTAQREALTSRPPPRAPAAPAAPARPSGGRGGRKTAQRGVRSPRELRGPEWLPPAPGTMGGRGKKG